MDLADIKSGNRKALHGVMSVGVSVTREGVVIANATADKAVLGARWGNKLVRQGDLGGDYAEIFEGVDRLIFHDYQLDALDLSLKRGDIVTFPKYGKAFDLDQREPSDGPHNIYWSVSRV